MILTLLAVAVLSISLCLLPLTNGIRENSSNVGAYVIASVFWLGLAVSVVSIFITKKSLCDYRRKMIEKDLIKEQKVPGIICFSFDKKRIILYSVVAVGLILIVTDIIFTYIPEIIMFPILSVTIMSFAVHCVIDGKYYKVYKQIKESVHNEANH